MTSLDEETLQMIVHRGVAEIIDEGKFIKMLHGREPLKLKMGFDPSAPDIHLGHVVGLRKLRQLQELGHQVILIVGDWTAQIGDPSGRSVTRPILTSEEVEANAQTYLRQFFKVVDRSRTQVVWQSEWFDSFTLADVIALTSRFTVAQFLQREDFRKRWDANRPIAITELLYPLLQAYDSIRVQADIEFGGTDQKFNLLVGRDLQELMGQRPQECFLVPILVGTDGVQKMSKSLGNYISVEEPPNDQYGKILSLPDDLIMSYFELLTDVPDSDLSQIRQGLSEGQVHPMEVKKQLALEIVSMFWGQTKAEEAQEWFQQVVQGRNIPDSIPVYRLPVMSNNPQSAPGGNQWRLSRILVEAKVASSASEVKRLLNQGAVAIDGRVVNDDDQTGLLKPGSVIRSGRRRFLRVNAEWDDSGKSS